MVAMGGGGGCALGAHFYRARASSRRRGEHEGRATRRRRIGRLRGGKGKRKPETVAVMDGRINARGSGKNGERNRGIGELCAGANGGSAGRVRAEKKAGRRKCVVRWMKILRRGVRGGYGKRAGGVMSIGFSSDGAAQQVAWAVGCRPMQIGRWGERGCG